MWKMQSKKFEFFAEKNMLTGQTVSIKKGIIIIK